MGTDDFHKKRKKRNLRQTRVEQKAVLISLEDTKSSKYYFEKLLQDKKLTGKVIFAEHIGTNPKKVIEAIIQHIRNYPDRKYEKRWAVLDKDDWSKDEINGAIQRAKELGICLAISNQAYELWILLHFEKLTRFTHRTELNHKLNAIFQERFGVKYDKSSEDVYSFIIGLQKQAIENAKHLVNIHLRNHGKIDLYEHNPLTMIYELVEYLNTLYENKEKTEKPICFPSSEI